MRNGGLGKTAKKIILLLDTGYGIGVARTVDKQIRLCKKLVEEWKEIDRRSLIGIIGRLYESKIISYKHSSNGDIEIVLTDKGKRTALKYNIDNIKIPKSKRWDGLWRMVIFDIPEKHSKGRKTLAGKLNELGFIAIQKSVYIYPYECKKEIDFIVEVFGLRRYARYLVVKETDIDLDLKKQFGLN